MASKDIDALWLSTLTPAARPAVPAFRPTRAPHEVKADTTARISRELIDAQTEKRHANTARLKQARLERDAGEQAAAAAAPVAPKAKKARAPKA